MYELDLSRRLSPRTLRRLLIGGASLATAAAATLVLAAPALAHDKTATPLSPCTSPPLTTPCSATATPSAGGYTITLPGIGTLNITLDPTTNAVTGATVSGLDAGFTASAVKVDKDADRVVVTFTSTTNPSQVYKLKVAVKAPATAGAAPTVTAKVKGAHRDGKHHGNHEVGFWGSHGDGGHDD